MLVFVRTTAPEEGSLQATSRALVEHGPGPWSSRAVDEDRSSIHDSLDGQEIPLPRPSARIDLIIVRTAPDAALAGLEALLDSWGERSHERIMDGGFRRLQIDPPDRVRFYANQQGGFRVSCAGTSIARDFSDAVQAWRRGGARALDCPACGERHALETISLRPPGAFARGALQFLDAGAARLTPTAMAELSERVGPVRRVVRRVG